MMGITLRLQTSGASGLGADSSQPMPLTALGKRRRESPQPTPLIEAGRGQARKQHWILEVPFAATSPAKQTCESNLDTDLKQR